MSHPVSYVIFLEVICQYFLFYVVLLASSSRFESLPVFCEFPICLITSTPSVYLNLCASSSSSSVSSVAAILKVLCSCCLGGAFESCLRLRTRSTGFAICLIKNAAAQC